MGSQETHRAKNSDEREDLPSAANKMTATKYRMNASPAEISLV